MEQGVDIQRAAYYAGVSLDTANRWESRQEKELDIVDSLRSGRIRTYDEDAEYRIIGFYCQTTPLENCGRWTQRWAEAELARHPDRIDASPSRSTIQRILTQHDLQPHRVRYFMQITDPDFFPKMENIINLYLNPPKNLYCFDECPGLQILQRIVPNLRPADDDNINMFWKEFEYIRNGTTDLFCFLDVNTGKMMASCHPNHATPVFIEEFSKHVSTLPPNEEVHYIMDNLNTHCGYEFCKIVAKLSKVDCPPECDLDQCSKRREWLQSKGKRIVIHFTPFHGSWLNQAETCFRIIREKCLQDSYESPEAIIASIDYFVKEWNLHWAHSFNWKYDGKGLHEKVVRRFIATLKRSSSNITLQYIAKSCNLMVNILDNYQSKVNSLIWKQLFELIAVKKPELQECIRQSNQPKVSVKADEALSKILAKAALSRIAV